MRVSGPLPYNLLLAAAGFLVGMQAMPVGAADASASAVSATAECPQSLRYTFSWSLDNACGKDFAPRGGTSKGAPLTLDPDPHPGWLALREPGLSKHERDRRAILAMAGPYRTSFEFIETVGYTPGFERSRPYQSWGTEYIHVVEAREDFIQLQHIMVMFVAMADGGIVGPIVQKHWRQDWHYEKPQLLAFAGHDTWERVTADAAQVEGAWAQSVYQVDDSPRYEALGRWEHYADFSTWISNTTWRPLPRRESTVRDDYHVLEGTNRHTIIHNGWVHEEENYKVVLDGSGARAAERPYLAKELGVNRYERIKDFDWSAGDEYWTQTGPFWADVRAVWQEYFDAQPSLDIVEEANGVPLFAALFEQAETLTANGAYDSAAGQDVVRGILDAYIE
jgi:hypothetical protein